MNAAINLIKAWHLYAEMFLCGPASYRLKSTRKITHESFLTLIFVVWQSREKFGSWQVRRSHRIEYPTKCLLGLLRPSLDLDFLTSRSFAIFLFQVIRGCLVYRELIPHWFVLHPWTFLFSFALKVYINNSTQGIIGPCQPV